MKKKAFFALSMAAVMCLFAGCGKNVHPDDPVSTSSSAPAVSDTPAQETTQITETTDTEEKQGEKVFENEFISFTYNADALDLKTKGEGVEFLVTLSDKKSDFVVPRVDFIGLDTSKVGGDITEADFEELAKGLVTGYYDEDPTTLTVSASNTQINMENPACRTGTTIIEIEETQFIPKICAEVAMQYNEHFGAFRIALLDVDINSEDAAPLMKAFESMILKQVG